MSSSKELPHHHKKMEVCFTRPAYRAPNKPNAIKVYTVSQESCYILIQEVPALNLSSELASLLKNFGTLVRFEKVQNVPCETFREAYLAKYTTLASARFIKKKYDDFAFFGSQLHLSYAPEYETVEETCDKLNCYRKTFCKALNSIVSGGSAREKSVPHHPARSKSMCGFQTSKVRQKNDPLPCRHMKLPDSSVEPFTAPPLTHIQHVPMPTVVNIPSNPPTQQLYHKTTKFLPLPRQVKMLQNKCQAGSSVKTAALGESGKLNNLLISHELLEKTSVIDDSRTNYKMGCGSSDSHTSVSTTKEKVIKKRRRI